MASDTPGYSPIPVELPEVPLDHFLSIPELPVLTEVVSSNNPKPSRPEEISDLARQIAFQIQQQLAEILPAMIESALRQQQDISSDNQEKGKSGK